MPGLFYLLSSFLFLLVSSQTDVTLVPDVPVSSWVPKGGNVYFQIPLSVTDKHLTITVTPISAGDPDLFASLDTPHPTTMTAHYVARVLGVDSVTIPLADFAGHDTCYITVNGWLNVNFTIVASFEGTVQLLEGMPQMGAVPVSGMDYLTFTAPAGSGDVTITVTPLSGTLSVYVSGTVTLPVRSDSASYQWRSTHGFSGEVIVIRGSDAHYPATGVFLIGIYGYSTATYSIVAATNSTSSVLANGVPQQGHAEQDQRRFYKTVVAQEGCSLDIIVTPISGDPDLYVSRTEPFPTRLNAERVGIRFGADDILFTYAPVATYYITVNAFRNSTFTIVAMVTCGNATRSDFSSLVNGLPQGGTLNKGDTRYYQFAVQYAHTDLTISLTRLYGDPDLFVTTSLTSNHPGPDSYTWASMALGEDLLTIDVTDPNFCDNCTYFIAVYGAENSSYSIAVTTSNHMSTLQDGVPFREDLRAGEYEYFKFPVTDTSGRPLTVTVTDLGRGDPDLFMSTVYAFPNVTHNSWSAQRLRGDSITIPATDANYCQNCVYYISVRAFSAITFTIVASFSELVTLQDGVPQTGVAARGAMTYYNFRVSPGYSQLTLTLTTTNGQNSLYVSSTGTLPEITDYTSFQWFSVWFSAVKTMRISEGEQNACRSIECSYNIGVLGIDNSSFVISATTSGGVATLQNGVPLRRHVDAGAWAYFTFKVETPGLDLSIMVTPISGDPDIYVSLTTPRPDVNNYNKSSIHFGFDSVDYLNAPLSMYYIGITAFNTNTTFDVTAILVNSSVADTTNVMTLLEGEPSQRVVFKGHTVFYAFDASGGGLDDLTISCTKLYGDPDLYVTADGSFPSPSNHQWLSTNIDTDSIHIDSPPAAVLLIGVNAFATSSFVLTISTSRSITQLQEGVPLRGDIAARTYSYYKLHLNDDRANTPFTITVTPFTGDPDLFVSTTNPHPNLTDHMWAGIAFEADSVTIPPTSEHYCMCTYYISVYSFTATSFAIQATFTNASTLIDGVPAHGRVRKEEWRYYRFASVSSEATDVTFSLTPLNGNPNLYISTRQWPELNVYDWRSTQWYTGDSVIAHRGDTNYCAGRGCVYYIGVYGMRPANYSLMVASSASTMQLENGKPRRDSIGTGQFSYFMYQLLTPGQDLFVTVTPLTGDPDLYMSRADGVTPGDNRPNITNFQWSSRAAGSDAVSVANAAVGTYFIGVYAYRNSSFSITVYAQSPADPASLTTLLDGVPQGGLLAQGTYRYYVFNYQHDDDDGDKADDLTISVSKLVGDPDIFVSMVTDLARGPFPNATSYQWHSTSFGQDLLSIRGAAEGFYVIGIYAFTTCDYTLVLSTDPAIVTLSDGVPFREDLRAMQYEYFSINVDRIDMDLTFIVTSLSGDPDLFVSDVYERPNISFNSWHAQAYREDAITISAEHLHFGMYYVSVFAFTNCTFTLVATFRAQSRLLDGVPQGGYATAEQKVYYTLDVGDEVADITITATPLSGNVLLFVSNMHQPDYMDPSTYDWRSNDWSTVQHVNIHKGDRHYCTKCTYYVMVYGQTTASYSLLASTSSATIVLQEGVPRMGWVDTGTYAYFSFKLEEYMADVAFSVTPLSGDPDVYVSTHNQRPNTTSYLWKSVVYGGDTVHIDYTDPNYRLGSYYIGVYAWQNATFTITATVLSLRGLNNTDETMLIGGLPQIGFLVNRQDTRYYRFNPNTADRMITFSVTPRYGDPDLYVTGDGSLPSSTHYQWSAHAWGADQVSFYANCADCVYRVAVVAFTHTLYSIVAYTEATIRNLEVGVPLQQHLNSGEWSYYSFQVRSSDQDLVISATALTGDPDLYISRTCSRPNETCAQWRSLDFGTDVYTIIAPERGTYYIGAKGFRNTTFILTVTLGATTLLNGQPHEDLVQGNSRRTFAFQMDDPTRSQDLAFNLALSTGEGAVMYVANSYMPSKDQFQWSTVQPNLKMRGLVQIAFNDPLMCFNCTFFVSVEGRYRTPFTLTAMIGGTAVLLSEGVPVTGTVAKGEYRYFRAIVDTANDDVNIDVTTYVGDIALVVATGDNHVPTLMHNQWSQQSDARTVGDHLSISHRASDFITGYYYIGVYGVQDSKFSITVATHSVMLQEGIPQISACGAGPDQGSYFFFNLDIDNILRTNLYLSVASYGVSSDPPSFTVFVDNNSTQPSLKRGNAMWSWAFDSNQVSTIYKDDVKYCSHCTYYVGVFCQASQPNTQFTVQLSLEDSFQLLLDGSKLNNSVVAKEFRYYEMSISKTSSLSLLLEPCVGNADLYASQDVYRPNQTHYKWKLDSKAEVDKLDVRENLQDASIYIGVYGATDAVYVIHASTSESIGELSPTPGQHGAITLATTEAGAIAVTFASATPKTPSATLEYTVYFGKTTENIVMYSLCGLEYAHFAESRILSGSSDTVQTVLIKDLELKEQYLVNVVVKDDQGHRAVYKFGGPIQTTDGSDGGGVPLKYLLGVGVPVGIVVLVGIVYLIIKNRKLTKELEIEMHDVPKAAVRKAVGGTLDESNSTRSPNERAKEAPQKYHKLLTEDEDEPEITPASDI